MHYEQRVDFLLADKYQSFPQVNITIFLWSWSGQIAEFLERQ